MWVANDGAQSLILEIEKGKAGIPALTSIRGGKTPGTYVVKELVYAYAMWISAAFQLKVIRAFDTLQTKGVAVAEHAAEDLLLAFSTIHKWIGINNQFLATSV